MTFVQGTWMFCAAISFMRSETWADDAKPTGAEKNVAANDARVPAILGNGTTPGYELTLASTAKDKVATASATWLADDGSSSWQIKLAGPISDKPDAESTLATLDGLSAGTTATVTHQRFSWGYDRETERLFDLVCDLGGAGDDCDPKSFENQGGLPVTYDLRSRYSQATASDRLRLCAIVALSGAKDCSDRALASVNLQGALLAATQGNAAFSVFGFSGSTGRAEMKYLDPAFADTKVAKTSWNATAYVGIFKSKLGYFDLRATLKNEWQPAQKEADEICRPIPSQSATRCKTIVIGEPTKKQSRVATFEWRRFVSEDFAVSTRLQYDIKGKVWAFELPAYFLKSDKGLTGGARFGWRSDKKEITFGVFVGASAFGLIG